MVDPSKKVQNSKRHNISHLRELRRSAPPGGTAASGIGVAAPTSAEEFNV
jgi:hypothetical protein